MSNALKRNDSKLDESEGKTSNILLPVEYYLPETSKISRGVRIVV